MRCSVDLVCSKNTSCMTVADVSSRVSLVSKGSSDISSACQISAVADLSAIEVAVVVRKNMALQSFKWAEVAPSDISASPYMMIIPMLVLLSLHDSGGVHIWVALVYVIACDSLIIFIRQISLSKSFALVRLSTRIRF